MTHVISIINLKGGVGKTTTTVALAEAYASEMNKRVLVIDLDPQTNATITLIPETKWQELNQNGYTLAQLFKDALIEEQSDKKFNLEDTLQRRVSDVKSASSSYPWRRGSIDLLPSSLDLIDVQDRLASMPRGRFYSGTPTELLARTVNTLINDYDIVLVDCPPNLGIITLNGLRISQGYIIPTIPDVLSTYGIPQIVSRVNDFSVDVVKTIEPLGIVITKYQSNSTVHRRVREELRDTGDAPIFNTIIRQTNQIAAAAEYQGMQRTFRQKYGYGGHADAYLALAEEVIQRLEA